MTGQKGITWHRFRGREIAAEWSGFSETPRTENAREITEALLDAFSRDAADGGVDEIHCVYTEFVSMLTQRSVVRRIPPIEVEEATKRRPAGRSRCTNSSRRRRMSDALLPWYVGVYHHAGGRRSEIGAAAGDEVSYRQRQRAA